MFQRWDLLGFDKPRGDFPFVAFCSRAFLVPVNLPYVPLSEFGSASEGRGRKRDGRGFLVMGKGKMRVRVCNVCEGGCV